MTRLDAREEVVSAMKTNRRYTVRELADMIDSDVRAIRINLAALAAAERVKVDGDKQTDLTIWTLADNGGDDDE